MNLREGLVPLTPRERLAMLAGSIVVAVTRVPAISRTLWDADEALFALALEDYDVTAHHPHPPGFPLFILTAKLIAAVTGAGAFHALQAVTVVASMFVFPAMFFLARELRATPFVATSSSLLLSFLPNVWFFGGTAFSDVPSLVLAMVAAALLLRGCRSDLSLVSGAVLLAVAAGFRPQNLIIGMVPALLALRCRPRVAVAGAIAGVAIMASTYGAAASLSGGWDAYRATVTEHQRYIRETDSFLAPMRPGLLQVADDFFVRPFRAWPVNLAIAVLAAAALLRKRGLRVVLVFAPFLLFAWLFLDFHSASRFSIGYMPMFALLAAEGIPLRGRRLAVAAVVVLMVAWTWPALEVVRGTESPPVTAAKTLRDQKVRMVYVDERLRPHAELLLPNVERRVVHVRPPFVAEPGTALLKEGASQAPGAVTISRELNGLGGIARRRYFEVSVIPGRRPADP